MEKPRPSAGGRDGTGTIKSRAAKGEIVVTKEELVTAAMSHPITAARVKREPDLCEINPPPKNKMGGDEKNKRAGKTDNEPSVLVTLTIAANLKTGCAYSNDTKPTP